MAPNDYHDAGEHIQQGKTDGNMAEEVTWMESPKTLANGRSTGKDGLPFPLDSQDAVSNSNAPSKGAQAMVSFLQLYSFADKCDYVLMVFGTIGGIVHGVTLPLLLWYFGKFLNAIGQGHDNLMQTVNKYAVYFELIVVAAIFSSWLEVSLWMQTGERQSAKLRVKYLQALLRQDVSYFDTDASTGDFVNSIASDPVLVQDAIGEKAGNIIHYFTTCVASFVVGILIEWRIAILTLAVIPPIALVAGVWVYYLSRFTSQAASAYSEAGSIAEQAISQIRTVYSFVGEAKCLESYSTALQKNTKLETKGGLAKGVGMGATFTTLNICYGLLLIYGGVLIRKGETNGAQALAAIFSVMVGSGISLGQALPNLAAIGKARAAAFNIFEVLRLEPTINRVQKGRGNILDSVQGHIELRNVDFYYPSRPDALIFHNFSLTIPPGQTVAIVGSSGSGKSTVISLIERFYDPTGGEVLLDGHDLKKLNLRWLRQQIGLVNQEPSLFATTIVANIMYGINHACHEEIEEAAKLANLHSFISQLPQGYQTQVGEGGIQLSGGQRQRIAIARAVLRNPRVLLLDEATSALDAGSELMVQKALDRIMVGRTTVVVAHRLSTVRNADIIAVVQQGHIVESGSHEDLLLREDGAYSALIHLQQLASTTTKGSPRDSIPYSRSLAAGSPPGGVSPTWRSLMGIGREEVGKSHNLKRKEECVKASKRSLLKLVVMTMDDWKYSIAGLMGSMLAGCIHPSIAVVLGEMLSIYYRTDKESMKKGVLEGCLVFIGIGVAAPFIFILQHYPLAVVGERLVKHVREKMFATILRNEPGWFDEEDNNSSQVAGRLASDAANVRVAIGDTISLLLQNFTLLVLSLVLTFSMEWKIALVMIGLIPTVALGFLAESWVLNGFAGDKAKAYSIATQIAGEAVANIRTLAALNAEDKTQALYALELEGPAKQSFWKGQKAGFGYGLAQYLQFSSYALLLWYSGVLVERRLASFGACAKTFMIIVTSSFAAAETLTIVPTLSRAGQAVASVFQVLDRVTRIEPNDSQGRSIGNIRGDIELKDVTLAYPSRPDLLVLRKLTLMVHSGNSLALVGASGSGKSSVISLIERFYDPISGEVLIDGIDIRRYNLLALRQHIALVQQEPALFATTIYENILYGKSALPDGYKTQVGEKGVQISGGQKQRIAIARAVLKDPAIFLLDEATSALDAESEKIVQDALERLMKGRTTVIVAHRLSTIQGAGSIAVLHDGNVVEEGTHSGLLRQGGRYACLIDLQSRVYPGGVNELSGEMK
ncbi:unnamed protein product [Calypogeia fissa]